MRLLFAFFCIANIVSAVGLSRQHAAALGPSLVFAQVGHRVGVDDDACGITCLPAPNAGSECRPLESSYSCDECHVDGDPYGCCAVTGYYPSLCSPAVYSDDCLAAADVQSRARSQACSTEITCAPACGVQTETYVDPDGNIVPVCEYDTCAGQMGCPAEPPPPVCEMGPWSTWSPCYRPGTITPVSCSLPSGVSFRTREPLNDYCNDEIDNPTVQSVPCSKPNTECAKPCVQSAWKTYTSCPACWDRFKSNVAPTAKNQSTITSQPLYGGAPCDCPLQGSVANLCLKTYSCDWLPMCPRDCVPTAWSEWSKCDKPCTDYQSGVCQTCTGLQTRTRGIQTTADFGGIQCGALSQTRACNTQQCPIDCEMSTWSTWSACTAQCGGGQKQRTRYTLKSAQYGGAACGNALEIVTCGTDACPVSCVVGIWGGWDRTCPPCVSDNGGNPGVKVRTRSVVVAADHGGAECPPITETFACPYVYCPVDCQMTIWSSWSLCTATCGGGLQHRSREVAVAARFGGKPCDGPFDAQRACNEQCCAVDCVWYWSVWHSPDDVTQDCSKRCGGGTQVREVVIVTPPSCGGKQCGTGKDSDHTQSCNTRPCAVDCVVGDWDISKEDCKFNKEVCSAQCGLGWCVRHRNIITFPLNGGAMCPLLEDWIPCNNGPCESPCEYSNWGSWDECPATCNQYGQKQHRTRTLLNPSKAGADKCTDLSMERNCDTSPCPIDCLVGTWSAWSSCPVTCGLGSIFRSRATTPPQYDGAICPYTVEIDYCDKGPCPVTCVVSDWSEWSPCPVTCVSGSEAYHRTRSREILRNGTDGCDFALSETEPWPCASAACPAPCILGDWTEWSACVGCGLQEQTRSRPITQQPTNGGRLCQVNTDTRFCQGPPCEVPCTFSPWSDWGSCTKSCSTGTRQRTRYLIEYDLDASQCPTLVNTQPCVEQECCPQDCKFKYSEWTPCNPQGYRRRTIIVTQNADCHGLPCPTCTVERDDCVPPEDGSCWKEDCPDD